MKLCVRVSKGDDDAMASGLAHGGFGVSYLSGRDRRQYVWAPSLALAVTTPLLLLGITRSTINDAIWLMLAGHITLFVYFIHPYTGTGAKHGRRQHAGIMQATDAEPRHEQTMIRWSSDLICGGLLAILCWQTATAQIPTEAGAQKSGI